MAFDFSGFSLELEEDFVKWLVEDHYSVINEKYSKFWDYYQNTSLPVSRAGLPIGKVNDFSRDYVQAQEIGLPARITGFNRLSNLSTAGKNVQRKEIVIENDIAWRINAMVDYLFGKGLTISSKAPDGKRKEKIDAIIKKVFDSAGGIEFFQNMSVLGSIYGFVDCIIRTDTLFDHSNSVRDFEDVLNAAAKIEIDLLEATHCLPVLNETNYKKIDYYIQHFPQERNLVSDKNSFLSRIIGSSGSSKRQLSYVTEIISDSSRQLYRDGRLVEQTQNLLGVIPVVHIQNIAQPCCYEGLSDVEPLMPLQDELNTRLSDRANRITMQSFKMYLAKGIEASGEKEIMPGRMWCTDNEQAQICEFGGDAAAPGEDSHIQEIREALDKVSGVTPVAAGVIRGKLGNLTSAVALKMTLMGTLAKTERKRLTFGEGIKQICRLILLALDESDLFKTKESERDFEIRFPNPLPEEPVDKLNEAKIKLEIGVSQNKVLEELGY
ncbi:MAG: phage portal protein [Sedimentisphaeraceae bacterium JB056]